MIQAEDGTTWISGLSNPGPSHKLTGEQSEMLQDMTPVQMEGLRKRARTNLYFLAKGILGYNQVEEGAHLALCAFLTRESRNRRLVLMPRGHLKTTLCTISDSIRLALCNPNVRILIQNEVFDNASLMLQELQAHWEKGEMLRRLFPDLTPERFSGPGTDWSRVACSINRSATFKESTWTASGSGGSPQSQHFGFIKVDDLIGEKHKNSIIEMQKAIGWTDAMTPLLDRLDDQIDFYGTRKTLDDAYAHLEKIFGDDLAIFFREPIENEIPIFSKMPLKELQRIMVNTPDVWAYDYMNNPIGKGGLDWGHGVLRNYSITPDLQYVTLVHHLTGALTTWHRRELDIVVTVDPNSGQLMATDKPAVVVSAITPDKQIIVLETFATRVSPGDLVNKIYELCIKWKPRIAGIEKAGQQTTMFYFEQKCMEEGQYWDLAPLKPGNQDKEVRIRQNLDTPLKARAIYILPTMTGLISQIQLFPQLGKHNWDEIDALAYGPQLYQPGMRLADIEAEEDAEKKILAFRGPTGYGQQIPRRHLGAKATAGRN